MVNVAPFWKSHRVCKKGSSHQFQLIGGEGRATPQSNSQHQLDVPQLNSILTLCAWKDSTRFHRLRVQSYETAGSFRPKSQAQVAPVFLKHRLQIQGFHDISPVFGSFVRTHRTQLILFTTFLAHCTRLSLRMEEMHRERCGERALSSPGVCSMPCISRRLPTRSFS